MLRELRVENLLLIERAELELADGLNVLTGETGAGKTVLAQALDLLMGARPPGARPPGARPPGARPPGTPPRSPAGGIVRPGAQSAYVEGVFFVPETLRAEIEQLLPESAREDGCGEELTLARRVGADGRTRAFVGGRSASAADLRELGSRLISFYGQHEHRKLVLAASQLQMLDAVCGPAQGQRLRKCAQSFARTRALRAELERLSALERAREQELGLLQHELAEIDEAAPDPEQHAALLATRERLRSGEALRGAAAAALEGLAPEAGEGVGAAHLLAAATDALQGPAGADAELDALAARARTLAIEAEDLAGAVRAYVEGADAEEGSLQGVEERLAGLERLLRKHGGTIEAVLEYGERARARSQELSGAERAREQASAELGREQDRLDGYAHELRQARRQAAVRLGEAVHEQLAALAMPAASFSIELSAAEPRASGADAVEFAIAPNPGVPATPLRETASGGELSRVMLALASACEQAAAAPHAGAAAHPTLVFDEIDAGIGGHTARAVGERLQGLAHGRQLICITHLPQIASLAERHFTVSKDTAAGTALTTVTRLCEHEVEDELMRMLGAGEDDAGARKHARELRKAA